MKKIFIIILLLNYLNAYSKQETIDYIEKDNEEVVQRIVTSVNKMDYDLYYFSQDENQMVPLIYYAIKKGNDEIFNKLLIKSDINNLKVTNGDSLIDYVLKYNRFKYLEPLLKVLKKPKYEEQIEQIKEVSKYYDINLLTIFLNYDYEIIMENRSFDILNYVLEQSNESNFIVKTNSKEYENFVKSLLKYYSKQQVSKKTKSNLIKNILSSKSTRSIDLLNEITNYTGGIKYFTYNENFFKYVYPNELAKEKIDKLLKYEIYLKRLNKLGQTVMEEIVLMYKNIYEDKNLLKHDNRYNTGKKTFDSFDLMVSTGFHKKANKEIELQQKIQLVEYIIKKLLKKGYDVMLLNKEGLTAYEIAKKHKLPKHILKLLGEDKIKRTKNILDLI